MNTATHKPRLIFWEVTKGCNLRCIHCRATATELSSPNDLPTTIALNIIKQVSQLSSPILVLSGGEPLFRDEHKIGPTEMITPGLTGITPHPRARPAEPGQPEGMNATTNGFLAGTGVASISNQRKKPFCAYQPHTGEAAGDHKKEETNVSVH